MVSSSTASRIAYDRLRYHRQAKRKEKIRKCIRMTKHGEHKSTTMVKEEQGSQNRIWFFAINDQTPLYCTIIYISHRLDQFPDDDLTMA